jgi:hypothetical protein
MAVPAPGKRNPAAVPDADAATPLTTPFNCSSLMALAEDEPMLVEPLELELELLPAIVKSSLDSACNSG